MRSSAPSSCCSSGAPSRVAARAVADPTDGWGCVFRTAAGLAHELGEALHVVHAAGIIHRDVKPSNILLRPTLTPRSTIRPTLADFGIAYLVDTTRLTAPGTAIGTAAYLAPEQVQGAAPTTASDVYALGLVLIEALTGRRAFPQQTPVEAIAARQSMQAEIPGALGHGWRSLLTAMTAREPGERPTALEVAARSRALDAAPEEPEVTALAVAPGVTESSVPPRAPAPAATPAATLMLPTEQLTDASVPDSAPEPVGVRPDTDRGATRSRRRGMVLAVAALLIAAMLALVFWTSNLQSPPRAARPAAGGRAPRHASAQSARNGDAMMSRAGWRAPVIVCTLLLSGCASADSDLTGEASTQLQSLVVSVAETAATGDLAAALAELDALQQELDAARARGDVSDERAETIQAAIDLVRVDLVQATEPEPANEPTAPVESPTSVVPETDEDGNSGNGNGNDGDGGDGNDGNSGDGNDGDGDGNNGNGNSGNRGNGNG